MAYAIYKEGRRSVDTTAYATHEIFPYSLQVCVFSQSAFNGRCWHPRQVRLFSKILILQFLLVRIEHVVHFPELVVIFGCLNYLSAALGMWVIAPAVPQIGDKVRIEG
jgi:hypothetical protein